MASQSGGNIGDNIATALRNSIPTVSAAAEAVANAIKQMLKVKSPTEKGPMSDLDTWWSNLTPTLLGSFDSSGLRDKLSEAFTVRDTARAGSVGGGGDAATASYSMARVEQLLERIEKHTQTTAAKPNPSTEVHVAGAVGIDASTYRARR